jgi:lipoate-protein ligase A
VLSIEMRPALRAIDRAHRLVLSTVAAALEPLAPGVRCRGTSDLVIGDAGGGERKFSGNSVRCKRRHLLYHGTLLYDFPLELIGRCLTMPPRQPAYRQGRDHQAFVGNLPLSASAIRGALIAAWGAAEPAADWPRQLTARLAAEKYRRWEWNEPL